MDGAALQNLISKGLGVAGRRTGVPCAVFRPASAMTPLAKRNRILTLSAAFEAPGRGFTRGLGYGHALWSGVFDTLYTQAGDYLCADDGRTYFIAAQLPLQPCQCVRTNAVLSVERPDAPAAGYYGALAADTALPVICGWPGSLLGTGARVSGSLPELRFGNWEALLPILPVPVLAGDVLVDDQARRFLVGAAEQSDLGWRLMLRQAGS